MIFYSYVGLPEGKWQIEGQWVEGFANEKHESNICVGAEVSAFSPRT